ESILPVDPHHLGPVAEAGLRVDRRSAMERRQGSASSVHRVALRTAAQDHSSRGEDRLTVMREAATPALHARLRETTRTAHRRLESALNLLEPPILASRVVHLLERFHGFHADWEPALAA